MVTDRHNRHNSEDVMNESVKHDDKPYTKGIKSSGEEKNTDDDRPGKRSTTIAIKSSEYNKKKLFQNTYRTHAHLY